MDSAISKELKIGDPLPYDLILANGQMTFPKGTAITSEILRIINAGNVVQVTFDTSLSDRITDSAPQSSAKEKPKTQSGKHLEQALMVKHARSVIQSYSDQSDDALDIVQTQLSKLWSDPSMKLQMSSIVIAVDEWVESLSDMEYVCSNVGWNQADGSFIPTHMLNVARMASAIGFELGYETSTIEDLTLAGLMLDIGELFIDHAPLMRNGELSKSEINRLREHPRQSLELLKRAGLNGAAVHRLVLRHHERFDGSGYPYNITGKVLGDDDCIISICDVYCAMISPRPYRKAFTRRNALKFILSKKDIAFSAGIVNQFASAIGFYPPGSIVKLKSGDIAVVMQSPKNSKWLALKINADSDGVSHVEIDLNNLSGDYIIGELA